MKPGPIVYGPQGEQVANMHVAMLDQEEHKANAKAIAAVPRLLEALESALSLLESANDHRRNAGLIEYDTQTGKAALLAAGYTE